MKMPIGWHKECLKNWKASLDRDERQAAKLLESIAESKRRMSILEAQIIRAEREGKEAFDDDRYVAK